MQPRERLGRSAGSPSRARCCRGFYRSTSAGLGPAAAERVSRWAAQRPYREVPRSSFPVPGQTVRYGSILTAAPVPPPAAPLVVTTGFLFRYQICHLRAGGNPGPSSDVRGFCSTLLSFCNRCDFFKIL